MGQKYWYDCCCPEPLLRKVYWVAGGKRGPLNEGAIRMYAWKCDRCHMLVDWPRVEDCLEMIRYYYGRV